MKRILGLDVGDKRIGVAISDELGITSRGLFTLDRGNIKADTQKIIDIIIENDCSVVVIGLPLNLSGDDSAQTEKARAFAVKLSNKLVSNAMGDVRVELFDERFTTVMAERSLEDCGVSRAKLREARRSGLVDQQAAVLMLGEWMRGKNFGEDLGNA